MIVGMVYIVLEYCTQSHLCSENYEDAVRGLKMTRAFRKHTVFLVRLYHIATTCWHWSTFGTFRSSRKSLTWDWRTKAELARMRNQVEKGTALLNQSHRYLPHGSTLEVSLISPPSSMSETSTMVECSSGYFSLHNRLVGAGLGNRSLSMPLPSLPPLGSPSQDQLQGQETSSAPAQHLPERPALVRGNRSSPARVLL